MHSPAPRKCFVSPNWTIRHLVKNYPLTKICLKGHVKEFTDELLDLKLPDFLDQVTRGRAYGSIFRGFMAGAVNNVLGAYYKTPLQETWDLMGHGEANAPDDFWTDTPEPVLLSSDKIGLRGTDGLPAPYYWASNGAWCVRYAQESGEIDQLCCWNWESGHRGSQALFTNGALAFGSGREKQAFRDVTLWPFGFENHWGEKRQNRTEFFAQDKSLFLELRGEDPWITLDWNARKKDERTVLRELGWDDQVGAWVVYVGYMLNRNVGASFYPPYPESLSQEEILAVENATLEKYEAMPDRPVAGNLYLFFAGKPQADEEGRWKWTGEEALSFQITAGTTREEAAREFQQTREKRREVKACCLAHYSAVQSRSPSATMPEHPNIEATIRATPLLMESLKLIGRRTLRHSAAPQGYVDTHTSLMTMRGMLYAGDFVFVDHFLSFLSEPAHRTAAPRMGIGTNFFQDGSIDGAIPDWTFNDVSFLALIGHLNWHAGGEVSEKHYQTGRDHLLRILKDCSPLTSLFTTRGYWPDHPLKDVGRQGQPWPVNDSGIWYEALRNWEILALRQGDGELAELTKTAAEKLRVAFVAIFFDAEKGLFCDAVDPVTRTQHLQYSIFGLHFPYGIFGHELIDDELAHRIAEAAYEGFYDASWKLFRTCLPDGNYHSPFESIYMHWLQGLTKIFRRARHQKGLEAIRDSFEFHYGKFLNFPENFNMKPDIPVKDHTASGWFCETLGTRCQVIIENFYGINLAPDNVGIQPSGMANGDLTTLSNLSIGKSRWEIVYRGEGAHTKSIQIDGQDHSASWIFPAHLSEEGAHKVEVELCSEPPRGPVLLEAAGLKVIYVEKDGESLKVRLQGPGRAFVKIGARSVPTVKIHGEPAKLCWDAAHLTGTVAVSWMEPHELILDVAV
jgi:hypothetical protein